MTKLLLSLTLLIHLLGITFAQQAGTPEVSTNQIKLTRQVERYHKALRRSAKAGPLFDNPPPHRDIS